MGITDVVSVIIDLPFRANVDRTGRIAAGRPEPVGGRAVRSSGDAVLDGVFSGRCDTVVFREIGFFFSFGKQEDHVFRVIASGSAVIQAVRRYDFREEDLSLLVGRERIVFEFVVQPGTDGTVSPSPCFVNFMIADSVEDVFTDEKVSIVGFVIVSDNPLDRFLSVRSIIILLVTAEYRNGTDLKIRVFLEKRGINYREWEFRGFGCRLRLLLFPFGNDSLFGPRRSLKGFS